MTNQPTVFSSLVVNEPTFVYHPIHPPEYRYPLVRCCSGIDQVAYDPTVWRRQTQDSNMLGSYLGLKRKCTRLVVELLGLVELLNASGRLRLDNEHTTQLLDRVPQVWLAPGATVASQTFVVCRLPIESAS